ncbi:sigma-70 family RNA polymerase sigma factor [Nocardioides sp. zg-ZUI104]|uniref:sigma-70 family RNA polymerase sigma factor n=1 Tax=Nocardioides faecalis TaxID=2803858 RepID=UPI001BCE5041|nr:sigma-70 family RNA polymerase sigma factor [Nocardioides faecalis]MBS4753071.1 sigma-70 family RNA polymerase sigma factor [Nocardioides faecalis]
MGSMVTERATERRSDAAGEPSVVPGSEELADFDTLTDRYQRELMAHCYRMSGSLHEAEDLVQETLLRAWRSSATFQGRSSVRTWLYRIATNVCLSDLEAKPRRPLPTGLGTADSAPSDELITDDEVPWLEPVPDTATEVADRDTIRLAFVAALQHLPARQRAVLILRDVLRWSAAETAETLETTTAAVNSALQRAHAQLAARGLTPDTVRPSLEPAQQQLLDAYLEAFWRKDIDRIVALLTYDATWDMPPFLNHYRGAEAVGQLVGTKCPGGLQDMPMLPTWANGQPAFGLYMRTPEGDFEPFQLQVLQLRGSGADQRVEHVTAFFDMRLFAKFGLPPRLPADFVPVPPGPGTATTPTP